MPNQPAEPKSDGIRTAYAFGLLLAASMLLAAGARAQTNACDQLKGVLAARIDASGVRGYTLETVPAGTPVPPDAKAIGTCESGASKILYRRWGASRPSSGGAHAAGPASAAQAVVVPRQPARRSPGVQGDRSLPPAPASAPDKALAGSESQVEAVRVIDRAIEQPEHLPPAKPVVTKVPLTQQASEFMTENWRWIAALLLLPIAGSIWAWVAHLSAYDKAGLPRGPKL